jgi:CBS domain-containing protein
VVDKEEKLVGVITIPDIKEMFANRDFAGWLLACDVAEAVSETMSGDKALEEAVESMRDYGLEHVPVVEENRLVGVLDLNRALRKVSAEVLRRRQQADGAMLGAV